MIRLLGAAWNCVRMGSLLLLLGIGVVIAFVLGSACGLVVTLFMLPTTLLQRGRRR